ncbi:hypothetical protein KIW84_071950 [Lathyrus oleraceus]|uniref:Ubiquitin-like protease family profile domain-containing protein n=1 Tax=Pisum sativum TaxID=3888 RepID=A0A9D4VJL4_PEA|nr:hypothetical protein KIW84_071950 [Pisum sativum]
MRDAVRSFVGWPSDLIFPDAETPTRPTHKAGKGISRRIESVASQKEVPGRKLKKAGKDISTTSGTKSQIMMRLEKMVEESDIMHGTIRSVDFDEGVFGIAHSEIIAKEDLQQLFEHEELGIAVIHTYIWYMYVTLMRGTELCNRFNFIAASRINTTFITKNPTSVKNELVDRFMAAGDNTTPSLYFLPFNSDNGGHWVLVAMDLSRLMVYYLDSLSGDWSKYPSMKKTVDAVHLNVDIYIQHPLSQLEYYEGPINDEEDVNHEGIINLKEEDLIAKFYEQVIREDFELKNGEVNIVVGEDRHVNVNAGDVKG